MDLIHFSIWFRHRAAFRHLFSVYCLQPLSSAFPRHRFFLPRTLQLESLAPTPNESSSLTLLAFFARWVSWSTEAIKEEVYPCKENHFNRIDRIEPAVLPILTTKKLIIHSDSLAVTQFIFARGPIIVRGRHQETLWLLGDGSQTRVVVRHWHGL